MELRHDDPADDAALARRISAGERDAEGPLCKRLVPRIRAYGLRHLRDRAAANDLAQQVAIVVIEALRAGKVDDVERLGAFVMGTCRNTVLDWRKTERRRVTLLERFGPSLVESVVEVDAIAIDEAKLTRCMQELAPRQQTILALTYFADREVFEIADQLAMSAGNVRVARHRALGRLHECLTRGEHP